MKGPDITNGDSSSSDLRLACMHAAGLASFMGSGFVRDTLACECTWRICYA